MTAAHYVGFTVLCTTKHNSCEAVQTSVYAKVAGIPVALLGLIGYVLILGTLLVRPTRGDAARDARADASSASASAPTSPTARSSR